MNNVEKNFFKFYMYMSHTQITVQYDRSATIVIYHTNYMSHNIDWQ